MKTATISTATDDRLARLLKLRSQLGAFDAAPVRRAYEHSREIYGDEMHWSGETLVEHCLGVLQSTMPFVPDTTAMIAILMHHALDDGRMTHEQLRKAHGEEVRGIIAGMYLLSHASIARQRISLDRLRLMFIRLSADIRPVLLTLCGYRHVLGLAETMPMPQQRKLCRDALDLYAPVAARLGIYSLKHDMERQAFPIAYPTDSQRILEQLLQIHQAHGDFLTSIVTTLEQYLHDEGVHAAIDVREKEPYSIFQKMQMKSLSHVQDVYDLFACRVIVDSEEACYKTLGLLHRIGHPVANRFKDYIAFPKPNGYRSLHTTLARLQGVPEGMFVEVQIRTTSMHREAQLGMAAHWMYKQAPHKRHTSLANNTSLDADFGDRIFALTPRGDIVDLPEGATPLDFAFYIHSAVGLSFRSARVNGAIVPLSYHLENGDIVEIMRYKEPQPSPQWMQYLTTAAAKAQLKRHLNALDRPAFIQAGKEMLNRELVRHGQSSLDSDLSALRSVQGSQLSMTQREDILMKVGQGAQSASSLIGHLDAIHIQSADVRASPGRTLARRGDVELEIPMPVRFARCCRPEESREDAVTGVVGRDGFVRVHRASCKLLANVLPGRKIAVRWSEHQSSNASTARSTNMRHRTSS